MRKTKVVAGLALCLALYLAQPAMAQQATLTPQQIARVEDPARKAKFAGLLPRFAEADKASAEARDAAIGRLKAWIEKRKSTAGAFARDELGLSRKAGHVGRKVGAGIDAIAEAIGLGVDPNGIAATLNVPVDIMLDIELRLRIHDRVIDGKGFRQEMMAIGRDYVAAVKRIEAKLFVEIGADVPDEMAKWDIDPAIITSDRLIAPFEGEATFDIAAACRKDILVGTGQFIASEVVGGIVGGKYLTEKEKKAGGLKAFGAEQAASLVAGNAIGGGLGLAGYSPEKAITEKLEWMLDQGGRTIVEGDEEEMADYRFMRACWLGYPHIPTRNECRRAMDAMEGNAECRLGFRAELEMIHYARSMSRMMVAHAEAFGYDTPFKLPVLVDPAQAGSPAEVAKIAREIAADWSPKKEEK